MRSLVITIAQRMPAIVWVDCWGVSIAVVGASDRFTNSATTMSPSARAAIRNGVSAGMRLGIRG